MKKSFSDALVELIVKYFGAPSSEQEPETLQKEQMVSYEVVYEPNTLDAHGQWMSEETLALACENFNKNLQDGIVQPNLFHTQNTELFSIADSWIQKELDVVVEATGESIKAGTWVCKLQYHSTELWDLKKAGIVGGVSIGCKGHVNHDTGEITNVTFDGDTA